jgi:hypothetical protein
MMHGGNMKLFPVAHTSTWSGCQNTFTSARMAAFSSHTVNFKLVTRLKRISSFQVSDILFRVCFKLIDFVFQVLPSSFMKYLLFEKLMLRFKRVGL